MIDSIFFKFNFIPGVASCKTCIKLDTVEKLFHWRSGNWILVLAVSNLLVDCWQVTLSSVPQFPLA